MPSRRKILVAYISFDLLLSAHNALTACCSLFHNLIRLLAMRRIPLRCAARPSRIIDQPCDKALFRRDIAAAWLIAIAEGIQYGYAQITIH